MADSSVTMKSVEEKIKHYLKFLDNDYASAVLALFLILYASLAAPKLPYSAVKYLDNWMVQLVFFFMIAYLFNHNVKVALISAMALLVTLLTLNRYKASQEMMAVISSQDDTASYDFKRGAVPRASDGEFTGMYDDDNDWRINRYGSIDNIGYDPVADNNGVQSVRNSVVDNGYHLPTDLDGIADSNVFNGSQYDTTVNSGLISSGYNKLKNVGSAVYGKVKSSGQVVYNDVYGTAAKTGKSIYDGSVNVTKEVESDTGSVVDKVKGWWKNMTGGSVAKSNVKKARRVVDGDVQQAQVDIVLDGTCGKKLTGDFQLNNDADSLDKNLTNDGFYGFESKDVSDANYYSF